MTEYSTQAAGAQRGTALAKVDPSGDERLTRRDWALLSGYALLLFGIAVVSGRPLTLHESVLPQTSRAMFADHDFLVPKIDAKPAGMAETPMPEAPWLENPPFPQWCTVAIASLFGRCDSVAIVRIGPTLVSLAVVLLVAWMSALWYGRKTGVVAGLVMATTMEFTRYAWLAEDEIYLCFLMAVVMALFVKNEFGLPPGAWTSAPAEGEASRLGPLAVLFGRRSWWLAAFFFAMGMTNFAKGLLFGAVMAAAPIGVFLLGTLDVRRVAKYAWFWGFLLFGLLTAAWPLALAQRYSNAGELWFFDLYGRLSGDYTAINQPLWYYPVNLLWMVLPWTFIIPLGLAATWKSCRTQRTSPERFLWCWAFVVPAVFSIPGGKHHHYLLHALCPWAILGALGIARFRALVPTWRPALRQPAWSLLTIGVPAVVALAILRSRIPGPAWLPYALMVAAPILAYLACWGALNANPRRAAVAVFGLVLAGYWGGHVYSGKYVDRYREDAVFLEHVRQRADAEQLPVFIDMQSHSFHGMLGLFSQKDNATLLQNLTFLQAVEIRAPEILLVSVSTLRDRIAQFGDVEQVDQSQLPGTGLPDHAKLTLYRLRLRDDLPRFSAKTVKISPMQAMHRKPGPFLEGLGVVTPVGYRDLDDDILR